MSKCGRADGSELMLSTSKRLGIRFLDDFDRFAYYISRTPGPEGLFVEMVVGAFHMKEPFKRMRARHELWKQKYPDRERKHGPAYTGISNARPATRALSKPPADMKKLPFDPLEFIQHLDELPFDPASEPGPGQ